MEVHFVKKARNDIWSRNKKTGKEKILVEKGTSYYYCKANFRDKIIFKNKPTDTQVEEYYFNNGKKFTERQKLERKINIIMSTMSYIELKKLLEWLT